MAVLLLVWLAIARKPIGGLNPFDFAISISIGSVMGAVIVDPNIALSSVVVAIIFLSLIQMLFSWLSLKWRLLNVAINSQPVVVVDNGQIIKANLRKVRIPVETLLQMLREKGVFDISQVELALWEPHCQLSVLRKPEAMPLTAAQLNLEVPPNRIMFPVIIEGELQAAVLQKMGFTPEQIREFREKHADKLADIFVAFMDRDRNMHIIKEDAQESDIFFCR